MNAYKLNGISNFLFRRAVCKFLGISLSDIYKTVKTIEGEIIETKDGSKYELTLKKLE